MSLDPLQTIQNTIPILTIVGGLALFQLLFPSKRKPQRPEVRSSDSGMHKWLQAEVLVVYGLAILFTLGIRWLLVGISNRQTSTFPSNWIVLMPTGWWFVPAIIIGLLLAAWVAEIIERIHFGGQLNAWKSYQDRAFRIDNEALAKVVYPLLILVALALVVQGFRWRTVFTADHIEIQRFWALASESFSYADIAGIDAADLFEAPNGKAVKKWTFIIHFKNGDNWTSKEDPSDSSEGHLKQLASVVSSRSGKPIQQISIIPHQQ